MLMGFRKLSPLLILVFPVIIFAACVSGNYVKTDPDVPFIPTPDGDVLEILKLADVGRNDTVYDLGSGDGRIVIAAAQGFGAKGVGIDIDPQCIEEATGKASRAGVSDQTRFIQQDLYEAEIGSATVVTLFLLPGINEMLRPKLFKELRPGTRVVSYMHDMGDWEPDRTVRTDNTSIYCWVIPAGIDGKWSVAVSLQERTACYTLSLDQIFQHFQGSMRNETMKTSLTGTSLKGAEIEFSCLDRVQGEKVTMRFRGLVDKEKMAGAAEIDGGPNRGTYSWSAIRIPD
jgi:SAM-dependent methyltransferase